MLTFFKSFPELQTNRLRLRQIIADDQPGIFAGLSHPEVIKYYGVEYKTYRDTQLQMDWYEELLRNKTGMWWAICTPENPALMGVCGFYNMQEQHRKAELGYWLLPAYWQQGIMHEALTTILPFGFTQLNLHRIEAFVETENTASSKLLEKLGFRHEGTMIECEIKKGNFISLKIYARLNK